MPEPQENSLSIACDVHIVMTISNCNYAKDYDDTLRFKNITDNSVNAQMVYVDKKKA
jgi:hypothetical protein